MLNKKLILENAIRFGFINELKKSNKNQKMIDYAIELGFAIDHGDEAIFPWNKTGNPVYETWLLNQLKDQQHSRKGLRNGAEDNKTLEKFISEFERLKKQKQISGVDINQLDFSGVKKIVDDNEDKISRKALERGEIESEASAGYEMVIFKGVGDAEDVAQIGEETDWCTAKIETAESHLAKGAIYIIFKNNEPYAQLHVETQQYMDVNDSPIDSEMWQELRQNIPALNKLVKSLKIYEGYSDKESKEASTRITKHIGDDGDYSIYQITSDKELGVLDKFGWGSISDDKSGKGDYLIYKSNKPFLYLYTKVKQITSYVSAMNMSEKLTNARQESKIIDEIVLREGFYRSMTGEEVYNWLENNPVVEHKLDLRNREDIIKLPENLRHIGGELNLENTPIKKLPDSLEYVGGSLNIMKTEINELPEKLKYIGGGIKKSAGMDYIKKLPDNLEHYGHALWLKYFFEIEKLPNSLKHVGGNLNLVAVDIDKLPDNLEYVGGNLDIRMTNIKKLPKKLVVKGKTYRD